MPSAPTSQLILPLHAHTAYSLLDGASHVVDYVKHAKANGLSHVAVTDHGNLAAWHDLATCSCKHGVGAIHGVELYLEPPADFVPADGNKPFNYYHLTLWALDETGYRNLSALCSKSWTTTHRGKPVTSWEDLALHSAGVACGSGCLFGPVVLHFTRPNEREIGVRNLSRLQEIFGRERLFLEVMPHAVDRDYTGRQGELISVEGEDGVVYRFGPDDLLETDRGQMTAKAAFKAGVTEIYGATPRRVQDGTGLNPTASIQPNEQELP